MNAIQPYHGEVTMSEHQTAIARTCLEAAEGNTMAFPQIVGTLMEAGFESYAIDFRRVFAQPGGIGSACLVVKTKGTMRLYNYQLTTPHFKLLQDTRP
jgi:hypothetical protein